MSVKTNVPGEDVCASAPLISFTSEGVLCNVLQYDVSQVLLLFHLFPYKSLKNVPRCCFIVCHYFFLRQPRLFCSPGFSFQVHFLVQGCSSIKFCFRKLGACKDYSVLGWCEFNNFGRQKYKVVNLQRKNLLFEMNKKQVDNSAVGHDVIIMLLAFIF